MTNAAGHCRSRTRRGHGRLWLLRSREGPSVLAVPRLQNAVQVTSVAGRGELPHLVPRRRAPGLSDE